MTIEFQSKHFTDPRDAAEALAMSITNFVAITCSNSLVTTLALQASAKLMRAVYLSEVSDQERAELSRLELELDRRTDDALKSEGVQGQGSASVKTTRLQRSLRLLREINFLRLHRPRNREDIMRAESKLFELDAVHGYDRAWWAVHDGDPHPHPEQPGESRGARGGVGHVEQ